jgi:Reverse transcriptase (RNA-dependent DNA polymerase)
VPKIPYDVLRSQIPMRSNYQDINGEEPSNSEAYLRTVRYNFSPLYGIQTVEQLAEVLQENVSRLTHTAWNSWRYYSVYNLPKRGRSGQIRGWRLIEAPFANLKTIQKKVQTMLDVMPSPVYLTSPVKGSSTVSNAQQHWNRKGIASVDIERFYRHCSQAKVLQFFRNEMNMAVEPARIVSNLVCFRGHVPTGAPSSPLVAFYSNECLFWSIYSDIGFDRCRLSLYADDLTISEMGDRVITKPWLEKRVFGVLRKHGFQESRRKIRIYGVHKPATVTGVIVMPDGKRRMPNRLHKKMYEAKLQSGNLESPIEERERAGEICKSLKHHQAYIKRGVKTTMPAYLL